jgi:hypothetical protein
MNIRLIKVAVCAFALLALGVVGADSATRNWNLRQRADGTTVFKENTPSAGNEVRVDRRFLTMFIADIGTAATHHVVVPNFGNSGTWYVTRIDSVTHTANQTTNTILTCGRGADASAVNFTSGTLTHTVAASAAGAVQSASPTANNGVSSNATIYCGTDGGTDGTVRATITFTIDGNY